ncbi:hypothetical protein DFJ74DRAFT_714154 [Hyaloraphidium curvatum]|nr:hypothetical protein DFJ74DRAFT_714154 [Hyaloraphidium curvatum]
MGDSSREAVVSVDLEKAEGAGDKGAPLSSFTAREWIALFPAPTVPGTDEVDEEEPSADPAASLRVSSPLTRDDLVSALAASPLLTQFVRVQLVLAKYAVPWHNLRAALFFGTGSALVSIQWAFAGELGRFSPPQLAVSTFVTLLHAFLTGIVIIFFGNAYSRRFGSPSDLSAHPLAVFARYAQLRDAEPGSLLLRHDASDPLCPCPGTQCAGKLAGRAAAFRLLEFVGYACASFTFYFTIYLSMPAVAYASITWNSPWAASLCVLVAALALEYHNVNQLASARANVAAIQFALRLHRRASTLALRGLLARYRTFASGHGPSPPPQEPYLLLQDALGPTWRTRIHRVTSGPSVLIPLPLYAVAVAVAGIALGNCLPGASLATLAAIAFIVGADLALFTASNAHVSVISSLFRLARTSLRRARYELDVSGPGSEAAQRLAAHHDRLISAFFDASDGYYARFMGFRVDAATARNVAATALTLAIGLWSILRGGGVQVTLYPTCG